MAAVTVVVPTFNRPVELRRLVGFLEDAQPALPVMVLDSSKAEHQLENEAYCRRLGRVTYRTMPPDTAFYTKLGDGLALVDTPAVCLCADDDVVIPAAVTEAAEALLADTGCAVAQGPCAQFTLVDGVRLTALMSAGRTIGAASPSVRVAEGLTHYEATLYAVQRTSHLKAVLAVAAKAPNLFAAELLTTLLALAGGTQRRIADFTHARSIAPSHSYVHWHPAELLAVDPAALVASVAHVRATLAEHINGARDLRLFDHAMLAYIADYMRPATARRLARMAIDGRSEDELRAAGWAEFGANLQTSVAMARLRRSPLATWLKSKLANYPGLRERLLRIARNGIQPTQTTTVTFPSGSDARITMERPFVKGLSELGLSADTAIVRRLVNALGAYAHGMRTIVDREAAA